MTTHIPIYKNMPLRSNNFVIPLTGLLPLVAALAGGMFFVEEQWTADLWLPQLAIGVTTIVYCLTRKARVHIGVVELFALVLWLWCLLVDVHQHMLSSQTICRQMAILLLFLLARNANPLVSPPAGGIAILTTICALHKLCYTHGFAMHPLFANPAGYAAALTCGLPFIIACILNSHKFLPKVLWLPPIIIVFWALWRTESRTAWFALLLAAMSLILNHIWKRLSKQWRRGVFVLSVTLLAVSLLGLYSIRPTSVKGRLLIYRVTATLVADAPIMGHGSHGLHRDYMPEQASFLEKHPNHSAVFLADNVPYTFNEVLGFIVKYGLIGFVLLLIIIGLQIRDIYIKSSSESRRRDRLLSTVFIIFFGLTLTSYPTAFFYIDLLIVSLFGATRATNVEEATTDRHHLSNSTWRFVLIAVSVTMVCFIPQQVQGEIRWRKAIADINKGKVAEAFDTFAAAKHALTGRPDFLYSYAAELNQAGKYLESNSVLQDCTRWLNNYDTELLAADNAWALGQTQKATQHLVTASQMIPSRFMPLYGLLQIYGEQGDTVNMRRMAQRILDKSIKVPSADVETIRAAAQDSLMAKVKDQSKH